MLILDRVYFGIDWAVSPSTTVRRLVTRPTQYRIEDIRRIRADTTEDGMWDASVVTDLLAEIDALGVDILTLNKRRSLMNVLNINLVKGKDGPKYDNTIELNCIEAVITEQGMESGLPFVDFVMEDRDGKKYLLVLTGRIVNMVSAAIRGVNLRNHGIEEP